MEGNAVHGGGDGILNLPVGLLQHAPDVLRHRAGSAVAGVNADEGGKPIRLQGRVDLVQGNLSWILAKFRAALPPGHRNESCLLQGTEGVADHNRITAGALRQQRTRDTRSVSGLPDKEQTVHRYGTFGGRVPAPAVERLSQMKANGAKAILVCVYGNRAYEDTLVELEDTAKQAGFRVIAGVAAVAEHSIVRQFAAGRPDEQDKAQLCQFAQEIQKKLEHGDGSGFANSRASSVSQKRRRRYGTQAHQSLCEMRLVRRKMPGTGHRSGRSRQGGQEGLYLLYALRIHLPP